MAGISLTTIHLLNNIKISSRLSKFFLLLTSIITYRHKPQLGRSLFSSFNPNLLSPPVMTMALLISAFSATIYHGSQSLASMAFQNPVCFSFVQSGLVSTTTKHHRVFMIHQDLFSSIKIPEPKPLVPRYRRIRVQSTTAKLESTAVIFTLPTGAQPFLILGFAGALLAALKQHDENNQSKKLFQAARARTHNTLMRYDTSRLARKSSTARTSVVQSKWHPISAVISKQYNMAPPISLSLSLLAFNSYICVLSFH